MRITDQDIALAQRLADAAAQAIRPYFRPESQGELGLVIKGDASPVTLADRAAEEAMRRLIVAERPRDGIQGEEFPDRPGDSGRTWVLDPIDGTRAFVAGRPLFGTLIALVADGWPLLGVIDQPILKERWLGAAGYETTLNGSACRARLCAGLDQATLATTSPAAFDDAQLHAFEHVDAKVMNVVLGGDCYNYGAVAAGWLDVVVEANLKLHDFAALVPVVEGAGGRMCDWAGDPLHAGSAGEVIAAGDPARIEELVELLGCRGGH